MRRGGISYNQIRLGGEGERIGMRVIIHCKINLLVGLKKTSENYLPKKSAHTRNLDALNNAKVLELRNLGGHRPSSMQGEHLTTDHSGYTRRQFYLLFLLPKYHVYTHGKHTAGCLL